MLSTPQGKPEIDYPCVWQYKVIGTSEQELRQAIAQVAANSDHTVALSKNSATGKYCSLNLEMTVLDEAHRLSTYEALFRHGSVKIVL